MIRKIIGLYFEKLYKNSIFINWQQQTSMLDCPLCASKDTKFFCAKQIKKIGYKLIFFETNLDRRKKLLLSNIPLSEKIKFKIVNAGLGYVGQKLKIVYASCENCGSLFQNFPHKRESIDEFYDKFYKNDLQGFRHDRRIYQQFEMIVRYVSELFSSDAKILEIGCAEGRLVQLFQNKGFEAFGIEPSSSLISYGCQSGIANLVSGFYSRNSYPSSNFDCIISNHVIEHVGCCKSFLEASFFHLKPGGCLLTYTPCADVLKKTFSQTKKSELLHPLGVGHTHIFSSQFLSEMCQQVGFEVVDLQVAFLSEQAWDGENPLPAGVRQSGMFLYCKKPLSQSESPS